MKSRGSQRKRVTIHARVFPNLFEIQYTSTGLLKIYRYNFNDILLLIYYQDIKQNTQVKIFTHLNSIKIDL